MIKERNSGISEKMKYLLEQSWRDESGQDLVEYSLLLAFVVVVSAALFMVNGASVTTIWTATNNNLSAAKTAAS